MIEVTEQVFQQFKQKHNLDNKSMKITEQFPDGSYNITYHLGCSRKVKMAHIVYSVTFGEKIYYYIY